MIVCAMGCSLACSLFVFLFQGTPALPPTAVSANNARNDSANTSYWRPYWEVLKNRDFNFLFVAFSISLGCIFALSTLLDQLLNLLEYSNVRRIQCPRACDTNRCRTTRACLDCSPLWSALAPHCCSAWSLIARAATRCCCSSPLQVSV